MVKNKKEIELRHDILQELIFDPHISVKSSKYIMTLLAEMETDTFIEELKKLSRTKKRKV